MGDPQQQQDPWGVASSPVPSNPAANVNAVIKSAPEPVAAALPATAPASSDGADPWGVAGASVPASATKVAQQVVAKTPVVTQRRYTAPGQGLQEFTAGSTDEQRFLQRFPNAKLIPQTYQRTLQPEEMQGQKNAKNMLGHVDTNAGATNTETPAAQTARQNAQAHEGMRTAAVGTLTPLAAMVAPEVLAAAAPELAGGTGLASVAANAAAEGTGAAAGTATGQAVTGENPLTAENLKETGKNALMFGGTRAALGTAGWTLGQIADWARGMSKIAPNVEEASQGAIDAAGGGADQGATVQKAQADLEKANDQMHQNYETKFNEITASANNSKVPVNIKGSVVQKTANDLLNDSRLPANLQETAAGINPESQRLAPFLRALAGVDEAGNPIKGFAPRYTWDEMEATRQMVGKQARSALRGSEVQRDLLTLRDSIDETMEQSARDAGMPELSDNMKNLRQQYAEKVNLFNNNAIKQIGNKNPNAVADILMSGSQSIQNVKDLRSLIGPENMQPVEGSILAKLVQRAPRNVDGTINAKALLNSWNKMTPDVKQAVWGDNLPTIQKFFEDAVKPNIQGNAIQQILTKLSQGTLAGRTGSGMVGGLMYGLVHGDNPQHILMDMGAVGLAANALPIISRAGPMVADALDTGASMLGAPGRVAEAAEAAPVAAAAPAAPVVEPTPATVPSAVKPAETAGKGVELSHTGTPDTLNTIKLTKDGEDIGMVNFTHDGSTAAVGHNWVDSSVRGQGHGQTLLKEAAKTARLQGAKILTSDPEGEMTAAARRPWEALKEQGLPVTNVVINNKPGYEMDLSMIDADGKPIPPETDEVPTTKEGVKATTDFGKTAKTPAAKSSGAASRTIATAATAGAPDRQEQPQPAQTSNTVAPAAPAAEQQPHSKEDVQKIVRQAATDHGVPPDLLDAQADQESKYNVHAVSQKGARGLMQFMPATAKAMNLQHPEDPTEAAGKGAELMAQLHQRFGRWDRALAGYNTSPDNVQHAVDEYGDEWLYHLPQETQNYVHSIMGRYAQAAHAQKPALGNSAHPTPAVHHIIKEIR